MKIEKKIFFMDFYFYQSIKKKLIQNFFKN
jgi:hypothetical protein